MIGIYIHIPFCLRKCPYCDFYSVRFDGELMEKYVSALCRNILSYRGRGIQADTIYFGGGTPSLLSVGQLERILRACGDGFEIVSPEVTLEANPCSVNGQKLADYHNAGVNRISFGVQSADDSQLRFLGRLHDFETAEKAVLTAASCGFDNISCDVMLGLAGQTAGSLDRTLDKISALPTDHISAYMLKIEEGTPFDCQKVKSSVADEDMLCDMYLRTVEKLEEKGFEQYEISNFAKNGAYSKHNLKYWRCEEYLGFGPAAHSFFENTRFFCPPDIGEYIQSGIQPKIISEQAPDPLEEYIMLGLRLKWGISVSETARIAGKPFADRLEEKARLFEKNGLCRIDGGKISLTAKGYLVSNNIISQFIDC